jgi:hypothetical protein
MKADNPDVDLEWMAYDFFTPQKIVADVYIYRFVFHNYPDEKAVEILKAAIPALKTGARILINDGGLPDPGEVRWFDEKAARFVYSDRYIRRDLLTCARSLDMVVRKRYTI